MSLVSQTLAQLSNLKTLEQEIIDVLTASDVAMSSKQIGERIPNPPDGETLSQEIYRMKKEGKIEHDKFVRPPPGSRGNVGMYRLSKVSDQPAVQPAMDPPPAPKKPVTRQAVADAIYSAGADGITQIHLRSMFSGHPAEGYSVVQALFNSDKIIKPHRGLLVDATFANAPPKKIITEPGFPEALQALRDAAKDAAPACVQQKAESDNQTALTAAGDTQTSVDRFMDMEIPPIVEDVILDDPETVEFCIYSSGGLDIFNEGSAITLRKPVLAKLRAFLGLFSEEL